MKELEPIAYIFLPLFVMEQGYKIHALEVAGNHVHLFLEFYPNNSLSEVV